ncbi:MarR family winged helix-turn-helix transcriptional regulator [Paraburkholderia sp. MMS20-SJTR3]|uniref:MarR family winged helix-turn-helix transcriptional regulator n=1 Tax=Paraburkholderia sejongensis TaxID=2886946 RepID=A0ABS8JXK5_9BURK|nr:MarR family winged helix-turn-helix transcriptional regulator [Paraburkholderia sp. MMS20-SJTR3]MCC8394641.1 MarR family winged helix-turn-helix transcriptional regulator [Paraburkholderia sp. MMS20-SJTR3]
MGEQKNNAKRRAGRKGASALPDVGQEPARDDAPAVAADTTGAAPASSSIEWNYFLTFKLDLLKNEMISRANASYRAEVGLDVRSLRVLRVICHAEGITATELKEQTLIEKTLLSKLVADLIERKLVRRSIHPDDARHFQLWSTAAGKRLRTSADQFGQSLETEMLSMLSADERSELNRIVDKLVDVFRRSGKQ